MPHFLSEAAIDAVQRSVDAERLLDIATDLVTVPSPTRSADAVADRLAQILTNFGFEVQRVAADWPEAPAVVVRWDSANPGRTLQFDGHLDTVHLPYASPQVENGILFGSGAADMKGGVAAAVEALLVLRELDLLQRGGILLTTHDHHEGPWGDLRQVRALIRDGVHGDAVLLPEYLADRLPIVGRGSAIFSVHITRDGEPVHEVLRPPGLPDVIAAGVEVMNQLYALDAKISRISAPHAGRDSIFVGSVHAGEIYNQSPIECTIAGVRRWVTPGDTERVTGDLKRMLASVAAQTSTQIDVELDVRGDAFALDEQTPFVAAFQAAQQAVSGKALPLGAKPFVDDGNQFASAGIPAISHGPAATGAHTVHESVALAELVRVAQVYALTAIAFCNEER